MNTIKLKIISLNKTIFEGEVSQVAVQTETGEIGVMANHVPLVAVLKEGITTITDKDGGKKFFKTAKGLIEVRPQSEAIVLVDSAQELK